MRIPILVLAFTISASVQMCNYQPPPETVPGIETPTGYVRFSKNIINRYGLSKNDIRKLQFYSDIHTPILFKATDVVMTDTTIRRSGILTRNQLHERFSYEINNMTPGICRHIQLNDRNDIVQMFIQFDSLSSVLKYMYKKPSTYSKNFIYDAFYFENQQFKYQNRIYELTLGEYSILYIKLDQFNNMIVNRDRARGMRVMTGMNKMESKPETVNALK